MVVVLVCWRRVLVSRRTACGGDRTPLLPEAVAVTDLQGECHDHPCAERRAADTHLVDFDAVTGACQTAPTTTSSPGIPPLHHPNLLNHPASPRHALPHHSLITVLAQFAAMALHKPLLDCAGAWL